MRVLHTSDWHLGRRLERHDRLEEHRAVVDSVVAIAAAEGADLVLHSGDLFDRAVPPVEALRLGLEGLVRLADGGTRPVVVVAGNHDSPELFETLAPFLAPFGVHLVGRIKPPDEGGIMSLETANGRAHVACFPFLRAAQTVDFMARADDWYGKYADRVRKITERYAAALGEPAEPDDATFVVAHFMVGGVKVNTGAPRGERDLHMGEAYAAAESAVPTTVDYVALGHIHAPQKVPGARVPAEYAGSLLQLDFGEAGEVKRVVVVDTAPDAPASIRSVPVSGGRPLIRVEGTWEEIVGRDDLDDAYLDLAVRTDGPDPGLMDVVRERFPDVIKVRAEYERSRDERPSTTGRPLDDLYADYHREVHGEAASDDLMDLFREITLEVADAAD
ncbi:MAG: exonuclease SbcCD subunit D C-terminal domain-containing protein [Acidimicrobiia bacterium]